MPLPHSKTKVRCLPPIPSFLPVMWVQSRRSCKGFGHSWLVAYSNILPQGALAGLVGDTVHNPTLDPTNPKSDMPECFTERWNS